MSISLVGLCGSLRSNSVNRLLMREAARRFAPDEFVEADLRIPLYDGDLEDAEGIPEPVQQLAAQIMNANAAVIVTPEYNQSFSGVLKNALDWISRTSPTPWRDKPIALMSAAAGRAGGARASYALRLAMAPFRPIIVNGPEVLVASASKEFDEDGALKSERYANALEELMSLLREAAVK